MESKLLKGYIGWINRVDFEEKVVFTSLASRDLILSGELGGREPDYNCKFPSEDFKHFRELREGRRFIYREIEVTKEDGSTEKVKQIKEKRWNYGKPRSNEELVKEIEKDENALEEIFHVNKPILGMVHLGDLYSPKGLDYVIERMLGDAHNLYLGGQGVDGLLIENWEERSDNPFVTEETAEKMLQVTEAIRKEIKVPIGVNILHNDYKVAFKIARELGLPFIQLDVYVDNVRTEFKHTQRAQFEVKVDTADVEKYRQNTEAALLVNIHPKHYILLEKGKTIEKSAKQAIDGGAEGVVVTRLTGVAPNKEMVKRVKEYVESYKPSFPVIIGSGVNKNNLQELLQYSDGAIVGTTFKVEGFIDNPVDPRRVEEFMEIVRKKFR